MLKHEKIQFWLNYQSFYERVNVSRIILIQGIYGRKTKKKIIRINVEKNTSDTFFFLFLNKFMLGIIMSFEF